MLPKIGFVTGIGLEETLLRRAYKRARLDAPLNACAAGQVDGAYQAAQALADQGATHLISFGVCGGLSPYVKAGDLIVADTVLMDKQSLSLNTGLSGAWHKAVMVHYADEHSDARLAIRSGRLLSVTQAITTIEDKFTAYEHCEAVAVDVESYAVAKTAQERNLPCLIIRAVLDSADQALPKTAMSGVDEAGKTKIWPVIKSLLKRPQDLPDLMKLAQDSTRAQESLKAAIKKGAPNFWAP